MATPLRIEALRRDDFLAASFELFNLQEGRDANGTLNLVRTVLGEEAVIVVHFAAQHVQEQAFLEVALGLPPVSTPDALVSPPVRARLAGPSRLAFTLPTALDSIPYTLAALLDWQQYTPRLTATALPSTTLADDFPEGQRPKPAAAPAADETAIEAPYRLILSPDSTAVWQIAGEPELTLAAAPVALWHVQLASGASQALPTVRAVWTRDWNSGPEPDFRQSLQAKDREQLVHLTADFTLKTLPGVDGSGLYTPRPVDAQQLLMTALGSWLDLEGNWEPPAGGFDIEGWQHLTTLGRDHYCRVVKRVYLFPFRHRAALITISERQFRQAAGQPFEAAYLFQRTYLVVVQREVVYQENDYRPDDSRGMPLRRVRVLNVVTPVLDAEDSWDHEFEIVVFPRAAGEFVPLSFEAEDWDGRKCTFAFPLAFATSQSADFDAFASNLSQHPQAWQDVALRGQELTLAQRPRPGTTSPQDFAAVLPAQQVRFACRNTQMPSQPPFVPYVERVSVQIDAVQALTGQSQSVEIIWNANYLSQGLEGANPGGVFANILPPSSPPPPIQLSPARAGGLITPNLQPQALSSHLGVISGSPADIENIAKGIMPSASDAKAFLEGLLGDTQLLGVARLSDLVTLGNDLNSLVPRVLTTKLPNQIQTRFGLEVKLQDGSSELSINVLITQPLGPQIPTSPPNYALTGRLSNFELKLLPSSEVITLLFQEIVFETGTGQAPRLKLAISGDSGIKFDGALSFLNELRQLIGSGLGAGPGVDVGPQGVHVAYSLGVPSIQVGIFSLENIAVAIALDLPFSVDKDTAVRLRFAFCERHAPFRLIVSLFGGGGFFGLQLDAGGVRCLEAALEFGASVSLNIGVASGGVTVMAGIYFRLELQGSATSVELSGYFRANGSLEVLGLIRISVEFYLALTYRDPPGKAWGLARVTVEVEVLFFSKSVSLTVERQFSGGPSDPTFSDLFELPEWTQYCEAFA